MNEKRPGQSGTQNAEIRRFCRDRRDRFGIILLFGRILIQLVGFSDQLNFFPRGIINFLHGGLCMVIYAMMGRGDIRMAQQNPAT